MAGQGGSTASALPAAAHVVGNAFVNQYYNVLHQSPQVVHRFYTDESRLTRAEAGADGAVETVVSQSEIHQKVMALDYSDFKAEIITVDSQDSLTGGVLVMVTGALSSQDSGKRNFVQSFFLAPQEKGYFVLNDVFRYLDEKPALTKQAHVLANGILDSPQATAVPEAEPSLPVGHELSEVSVPVEATVEEVSDSEHIDVSEAEVEDDVRIEGLNQKGIPPVLDEQSSPTPAAPFTASSTEEATEDIPKKSYASIVSYASILRMKENAAPSLPSTTPAVPPKASLPAMERPPGSSSHHPTLVSGQDSLEDGPLSESEDGRSVYVKHLPMTISSSHLEEEFGKFGAVKPGGVNIKSQKQGGVCYAFVEFEEATSAQIAIESSPVSIGGRQVYIEEKRPTGPRSGGRGSRIPGSGRVERPFRGEALRGRAPFTGRGLSSRPFGQDTPSKGRGTGPSQVRSGSFNFGGASTSSFSNSGNVAAPLNSSVESNRKDMSGGNGNRGHRRGGSQSSRNGGAGSRVSPPVAAT